MACHPQGILLAEGSPAMLQLQNPSDLALTRKANCPSAKSLGSRVSFGDIPGDPSRKGSASGRQWL